MKLKYEFPHFQEYVIQNLQNLIKISKGKDGLVFQLANMLNDKIVDIQSRMEERTTRFYFLAQLRESFSKFIQDQTFKRNWLDYEDIYNRQLFYWAKVGDFDKFFQSVIKFNIQSFGRTDVLFTDNQRRTIAKYHIEQEADEYSSDSSLDELSEPKKAKEPKRK